MGTLLEKRSGPTWNQLLRAAGVADLFVIAVAGLALRDLEAMAFATLVFGALVFLRIRHGIASIIILGVLSLDVAVFMVPAFVSNAQHRDTLPAVLIPGSLGVISVASVIAAVGSIVRHRAPASGSTEARIVVQVVIAVFALAIGAGVVEGRATRADLGAPVGTVVLVDMDGTSFRQMTLDVNLQPQIPVTFRVHNHDLFWHTFTIDVLHLNIDVPIGATRSLQAGALPVGRYVFYCRVPGHAGAGMKGSLTVR